MKTVTGYLKMSAVLFISAIMLNGCLITSVKQTASVSKGGSFESTITVTDKAADANPHEGIICVLTPDDWTYVSGTYSTATGTGTIIVDKSTTFIYGDIDTTIKAPAGMKWHKLITSGSHGNAANAVHEAKIKMTAGQKTGTFNIGYLVTKNTADMLKAINPANDDNDNAWADTAMNFKVTVTGGTDVEDIASGVIKEFQLMQNFPNPFNPSTVIRFNIAQDSFVKLAVYNSIGQEVATLVNQFVTAGAKSVSFDASNLNSGIYYYELKAGSFSDVKKMLFVK